MSVTNTIDDSGAADALLLSLTRLERQHRRLKRGIFVCTLVVGAMLLHTRMHQRGSLETTSLSIRDANGVERANLGLWKEGQPAPDGVPALILRGIDGHPRTMLIVSRSGTSDLILFAKAGIRPVLQLSAFDDEPSITLLDQVGQERAALGIDGDGAPKLTFMDERRNVCAELGASVAHSPILNLFDDCRGPSAVLGEYQRVASATAGSLHTPPSYGGRARIDEGGIR